MRQGDPRKPPLAPRTDLREPPSAAELADPALYQQYEQRQKQNVYASFASAVDQRIPKLEAMIAKGRAEGISEAQLAEGEAKLNRPWAIKKAPTTASAAPMHWRPGIRPSATVWLS